MNLNPFNIKGKNRKGISALIVVKSSRGAFKPFQYTFRQNAKFGIDKAHFVVFMLI